MNRFALVGCGGHGRDIAAIARAVGWNNIDFYDDNPARGKPIASVDTRYIVGVNDGRVREQIVERIAYQSTPFTLRHPTAVVGDDCELGNGVVVAAGAVLTTGVVLGVHTHVNVNATVSQSSIVGDYCTIGPGANICGDVTIGDGTFIGAGAVVANLVTIGHDVIVGAGAVVLHDVNDGDTVVGVPARVLERV